MMPAEDLFLAAESAVYIEFNPTLLNFLTNSCNISGLSFLPVDFSKFKINSLLLDVSPVSGESKYHLASSFSE